MKTTVSYEQKLAEKFARKVARQAQREWRARGNVEIGVILSRNGFEQYPTSMYVYRHKWWVGTKQFLITMNTFPLVHRWDGELEWKVKEV